MVLIAVFEIALRRASRRPARALAPGTPPAFVLMALVSHCLVGLDWTTSFLVGAVLAPTDPVQGVLRAARRLARGTPHIRGAVGLRSASDSSALRVAAGGRSTGFSSRSREFRRPNGPPSSSRCASPSRSGRTAARTYRWPGSSTWTARWTARWTAPCPPPRTNGTAAGPDSATPDPDRLPGAS